MNGTKEDPLASFAYWLCDCTPIKLAMTLFTTPNQRLTTLIYDTKVLINLNSESLPSRIV